MFILLWSWLRQEFRTSFQTDAESKTLVNMLVKLLCSKKFPEKNNNKYT